MFVRGEQSPCERLGSARTVDGHRSSNASGAVRWFTPMTTIDTAFTSYALAATTGVATAGGAASRRCS